MKTISRKIFFYIILAVLLAPAAISAKVYFLESEDESAGALNLVIPCRINYPLETCPDGKTPQNFCPTDNRYFQTCGCDSTVYQYDSTNCTENKTLSGNTCDGKYASCSCDSTKYMYDSTNCGEGKVLGGNSCGGKYETCGCDSTYSKTCSSPMVGSGSACDGKYQSCTCPSGYLTCNNGGDTGATQCTEENGTVKYSSCKSLTCEDNNYSSYVPSGQTCTQVTYNGLTCYKDCGVAKTCQEWISEKYPRYKILTGTISGDLDSGTSNSYTNIVIMKDIEGPFTSNNALSYAKIYNPAYFNSEFSGCEADYAIKLHTSGKTEFAVDNVKFYVPVKLVDGISMTTSGITDFHKEASAETVLINKGITNFYGGGTVVNFNASPGAIIFIEKGTYLLKRLIALSASDTTKTYIYIKNNANVTSALLRAGYYYDVGSTPRGLNLELSIDNSVVTFDRSAVVSEYGSGAIDYQGNGSTTSPTKFNLYLKNGASIKNLIYFIFRGAYGMNIDVAAGSSINMVPDYSYPSTTMESRDGISSAIIQVKEYSASAFLSENLIYTVGTVNGICSSGNSRRFYCKNVKNGEDI